MTSGEGRFNSAATMRGVVYFDGDDASQRYSRFWMLLVLSAIIASAGVVADSTATVIGAMIVAPLMTPILGTMLATVLGDRSNLVRSLTLVVAGAATAVAIGFLVGLLVVNDVLATTNPQVAGRVSPRLIDLLAALGTGVVGSVALVRRDISDTLPGVAIAISLVPPLTVAGLTLESGSVSQSLGALLLFLTNVVAILGTGVIVMSVYGVNRLARPLPTGADRPAGLRRPLSLIAAMFLLVGMPLTATSVSVSSQAVAEQAVHDSASDWADSAGWQVISVTTRGSQILLRVEGPLPLPDTTDLGTRLDSAGIDPGTVTVSFQPTYERRLGSDPPPTG
ncbi:MAG: DUF389 domain-containing protein [Cryobacterium sp.]